MTGEDKAAEQDVSPAATLFVVSAVQFLTPFMFSAVGVALPTIGRVFDASAVQLSLVEAVYIFAVALLLLPSGRFADIHGRKRIFITGTVLITVTTLILGLSQSIGFFIAFRFLQGAGAAMITSTSIAILSSVFPPRRRGRAMGIIVACVYMGLSAGPTLAGVMITHLGWRWVFLAAVPLELFALILTLTRLKGEWAEAHGERFDWMGSAIYMAALFGLMFGAAHLKEMEAARWIMGGGLLGMAVFLVVEANTSSPVLDVRLLITNRPFTFSNIATWINYAASFGVTFFFSIYLQTVRGFSPQTTGMILIVQPVIMAAFAPIAGRLSDAYPPGRIATIGMGLCAVGLAVASSLDAEATLPMIFTVLGFLGLGFGFFSSPNTTAIMSSVTARHYGVASSLVATMRSVGMLTSMTVITVILTIYMGENAISPETRMDFVASMQTTLMIFSGLSVIGILFSMGRLNPALPEEG